jgi:DNA-binding winged helix-turn-helix (wHTH) protein
MRSLGIDDRRGARTRSVNTVLTQAQLRIVRHMEESDGRIVGFEELAGLLESGARSPGAVIKVHMHAIRRILGAKNRISSVRGIGLVIREDAERPDRRSVLSLDGNERILIDGQEMKLTKQATTALRTIIEHGRDPTTIQEIATKMRSKTLRPHNLVKVLISKARKEAVRMGKTLPIRTIRGIGFSMPEREDATRRT